MIEDFIARLKDEFTLFCYGDKDTPPGYNELPKTTENTIYTHSPEYHIVCLRYHEDAYMKALHSKLDEAIGVGKTVLDVGCSLGVTGLLLAHRGREVTFHDYEGLGLKFLRWHIKKNEFNARVVPYGEEVGLHDWVLATDVIEHAGDPLAFLHWLDILGRKVILTYPVTVAWQEPWKMILIDNWVDDLAIRQLVWNRHQVFIDKYGEGRRYLGYCVGE